MLAPLAIRRLSRDLERLIVALGVTAVHLKPRRLFRVPRAHVRGLQDGSDGALGGGGVLADELAIGSDHATEVLRPGSIRRGAHHHVPDLSGSQLLGLGREAHEGIRVAIDEELDRLAPALDGPRDVLLRVETDIAGYAGDEGGGGGA